MISVWSWPSRLHCDQVYSRPLSPQETPASPPIWEPLEPGWSGGWMLKFVFVCLSQDWSVTYTSLCPKGHLRVTQCPGALNSLLDQCDSIRLPSHVSSPGKALECTHTVFHAIFGTVLIAHYIHITSPRILAFFCINVLCCNQPSPL